MIAIAFDTGPISGDTRKQSAVWVARNNVGIDTGVELMMDCTACLDAIERFVVKTVGLSPNGVGNTGTSQEVTFIGGVNEASTAIMFLIGCHDRGDASFVHQHAPHPRRVWFQASAVKSGVMNNPNVMLIDKCTHYFQSG
jgi:hypothetical protein